ncbi:hypothetical protein [Dethiosulfatarculus sandiegensis]|uniref:Uncharacterized protein n=1 Tax=Dethiosulfatarculus sandiegensis TaxID=1429043 RepID=A0A0D2GCI0_9BACT|nr:hypothetical protein [Dethiosulfatarculus sandiegensis]KIX12622.1 hypothetical protein X474_18630 [Dethiosulfatarculus sandiegensis]
MDQKKLTEFKDQVTRLEREIQTLEQNAQDFPALAKNASRVMACLNMMKLNLGLEITWPEGG